MGKRKDEEGASEGGGPTKRPRRTTNAASNQNVDHPKICQEIYETLRNYKADDGRVICETFVRAPSRRTSPEYHKIVSNPIDFMRIQQKLKTDEYDTVDQFGVDVRLLVENAKSFYKRSSQEYKDAAQLLTLYNEIKSKYFDSSDDQSETSVRSRESSPAPSTRSLRSNSPSRSVRSKDTSPGRFCIGGSDPVDRLVLESYLASVLSLLDDNGRSRCQAFKLLPSKEDYPDYYEVIKEPIDLKTIAERLRNGRYRSINDMERELTSMCRNAKIFNEPGSLIYKDANFIKKFVHTKKSELLETATQPIDKSRAQVNGDLIDELLQYTNESMELDGEFVPENMDEESDEEEETSTDDKFQLLYNTIRFAREEENAAADSVELSEPFLRLPSKTFYPDYYDEIKQPMSLFMINRKIKNGEYKNFEEMVANVNTMFNNAKLYNIDGSTIYMSACKLQHIGNFKAQELDPSIDTSQYVMEVPMEMMYGGDTEDSEQGTRSPVASPTTSLKISKSQKRLLTAAGDKPRGRPGRKSLDELMIRYRNKLFMLYNAVAEYRDVSGRLICDAFLEKPSKKMYPDYYEIIEKPMDLQTIFSNIENDRYTNTAQMAADFELIFENARTYNQEKSQIYNDATTLDWIFKNALRQLGPTGVESPKILKEKFGWRTLFSWSKVRTPGGPSMKEGVGTQGGGGGGKAKSERALEKAAKKAASQRHKKMMSLYNSIKDYKDAKGRVLSTIFMKLPSKADYPEYYEVIKRPIDLQKIFTKLTASSGNQYENLDALVQDFNLMFDNACKFNDPESTIYKDSLALQRLLLQKKSELKDEESIGKVPDVQASVQELLTNLFITVYNHQDSESRCYSDSLAELPDLMRDKDSSSTPLSLDDIKRNLDKGRYHRLDRFQQDVFDVFEKARQLSRSDSEIFEDAVELQQFFIKTRDELCKNGKHYFSPALCFDHARLAAVLESQRRDKQKSEQREDENQPDDPSFAPSIKKEGDTELDSIEINGFRYVKSDFVYVKRNVDDKLEPHIMRIARIWRDESHREHFISGNWFYRPYETYHLARRKFLEKEVFRTDIYDSVDVERLIGKCYVLFVRDYFKFIPMGYDDKDVYCCESKYLGRMKHSFKKMKYWHIDMTQEPIILEERPVSLTASRVPSIFVGERGEELQHFEEKDSDDEDYSLLDCKREESVLEKLEEAEPGAVYYEQIYSNGVWLKLGDGVSLKTDKTLPDIVRVDRLWRNADGNAYLAGVWFARPQEVQHEPNRLFYKKELLATERVDIAPLVQVAGKCTILSFSDYCTMRPVEVREPDVYVCESAAPGGSVCTETERSVAAVIEQENETLTTSTSAESSTFRSFKLVV